jgi:prepilin peptidase dependent protein B
MVGTTVALWLLLGAVQLMGFQLGSQRTQAHEWRLNQELRAAVDVMARDLKRAGHWEDALLAFDSDMTRPQHDNPFTTLKLEGGGPTSAIEYAYARSIPTPEAAFGFRRQLTANGVGVLQMKNGAGGWQPLTDPSAVNVTRLTITPVVHTVELWPECRCRFLPIREPNCEDTELQALVERPRLEITRLEVTVTGSATQDSGLVRMAHEHIHVRNAGLLRLGACPTH